MAVIYVRSTDGNDADNGTTWALAKATVAGALAIAAAGDTIYVSHVHAETQATPITWTISSTEASPIAIICVNDGAAPPTALATTGTVSTTGNNGITITGFANIYGLTITSGTNGNSNHLDLLTTSANGWLRFSNCVLALGGGTSSLIRVGVGSSGNIGQLVEFYSTSVSFAGTGQQFTQRCGLRWLNTASAIGGTVPTTLFSFNDCRGIVLLRGVDLSAAGSGKSIFNAAVSTSTLVEMENCKLGSSVSITTGSNQGRGSLRVRMVNCDSADTNYRYLKSDYLGDVYSESVIAPTSGPTDGTTPMTQKMVSSANTKFYSPLESDELIVWNDTTGASKTVTIEVVTDGVTLTDAEAWVEVEYLGTSGFPISSLAFDRAADILATPANQTTSSISWTTTGLSSPVKQKLSTSFTPQEKGPLLIRVKLAKPSTTMYVSYVPADLVA